MTTASSLQRLLVVDFDPLRDKSYQLTRLGPPVREYLAWKRMSRPAERTLDQIERDLARLCLILAAVDLANVTTADIMLVFEQFPPGSWKRVRAHLNGFFDWAESFDKIPRNPVKRLPKIKTEPQKIYHVFDTAELARVVIAARESVLPKRDVLGVLCFQDLGIRKDEGRNLQLSDFDNGVAIVKGKGGKERPVPMSEELEIALIDFRETPIPRIRTQARKRSYLHERNPLASDYIFFPSGASSTGLLWTDPTRPMAPTSMHRWWARMVERSGVDYRSLHMNRHTVGTDLAAGETDPFSIRDWLGHSDLRTTEMYVHNTRARLQHAADKLAAARRANSGDRN